MRRTVNRMCSRSWSRVGGERDRLANDYSKATQRVDRWQNAQESFNDLYPNKLLFRILLSEARLFRNRFAPSCTRALQLYYGYETISPSGCRENGRTTSACLHCLLQRRITSDVYVRLRFQRYVRVQKQASFRAVARTLSSSKRLQIVYSAPSGPRRVRIRRRSRHISSARHVYNIRLYSIARPVWGRETFGPHVHNMILYRDRIASSDSPPSHRQPSTFETRTTIRRAALPPACPSVKNPVKSEKYPS